MQHCVNQLDTEKITKDRSKSTNNKNGEEKSNKTEQSYQIVSQQHQRANPNSFLILLQLLFPNSNLHNSANPIIFTLLLSNVQNILFHIQRSDPCPFIPSPSHFTPFRRRILLWKYSPEGKLSAESFFLSILILLCVPIPPLHLPISNPSK